MRSSLVPRGRCNRTLLFLFRSGWHVCNTRHPHLKKKKRTIVLLRTIVHMALLLHVCRAQQGARNSGTVASLHITPNPFSPICKTVGRTPGHQTMSKINK